MEDVAQEPVLNVEERGDRALIGMFEGKALDHPWAGNVVDLCPVGSLLSKDFLNKARVVGLRPDLVRLPRLHAGLQHRCSRRATTWSCGCGPGRTTAVNRWCMCDEGRLNYAWLNRGDRIEAPLVRQGDRLVPVDWEQALERAAGSRAPPPSRGWRWCRRRLLRGARGGSPACWSRSAAAAPSACARARRQPLPASPTSRCARSARPTCTAPSRPGSRATGTRPSCAPRPPASCSSWTTTSRAWPRRSPLVG